MNARGGERTAMLSAARLATLAGFLIIAAIALLAALDRGRSGALSVVLAPAEPSSNTRFVVTSAERGGSLRPGDRIEIRDAGVLAAIALHALPAGSSLMVLRTAPAPAVEVAVAVKRSPRAPVAVALLTCIQALFIGIAALIALRGRSAGSLPLAWVFALSTLLVNPVTPAWPRGLVIGYAIAGAVIAVIAVFCATEFATRLSQNGDGPWAVRTRRVSRALALVAAVVSLGTAAYSAFASSTPVALGYASTAGLLAQIAFFLGALALAYREAPRDDRQRVVWVAASLGVGVVGFMLAVIAGVANVGEPLRDYPLALLVAMPIGCAYAILRYRLLDIAFVVNRATVFGLTSLLVLGALALVDSGLQALLGSWLVRTGLYVQLGLALVIGISTRPLHERVERLVDDIFFRQRNEAERALRRFAREVAYIDDPRVVTERTIEIVAREANLRCALLTAREDGALCDVGARPGAPNVDRNDEAVVRLRATREAVDLRGIETVIAGDFAFPMFARNRLLGILVCADKLDGVAAYAPDELDAIGAVAHAVGLAIDSLRIEALESELADLRARESPLAASASTPSPSF